MTILNTFQTDENNSPMMKRIQGHKIKIRQKYRSPYRQNKKIGFGMQKSKKVKKTTLNGICLSDHEDDQLNITTLSSFGENPEENLMQDDFNLEEYVQYKNGEMNLEDEEEDVSSSEY